MLICKTKLNESVRDSRAQMDSCLLRILKIAIENSFPDNEWDINLWFINLWFINLYL